MRAKARGSSSSSSELIAWRCASTLARFAIAIVLVALTAYATVGTLAAAMSRRALLS